MTGQAADGGDDAPGTDDPASADERPLIVGDRVIDRDDDAPSPARVVGRPDATASEYRIAVIGKTVAEANPDYPADDRLATITFEGAGDDAQRYTYPVSRLERVDDEWEPPEAGLSKAARERHALIDDHPRKFEAFALLTAYLSAWPDDAADELQAHVDVWAGPSTRGGCTFTRDDSYRPHDDDAIVCWHCSSKAHNRPRKFSRDDPIPDTAPCPKTPNGPEAAAILTRWVIEDILDNPTRRDIAAELAFPDEDDRPDPMEALAAGEPTDEYTRLGSAINDLRLADESETRHRLGALRIGYEAAIAAVDPVEYNHSRACAFLRDLGVDTDAVLPGGDPYK